jgi:biotin carboxyl carrier protein
MLMKYTVTVDGDVFEIEIGPGGWALVNQEPYEVDLWHVGGNDEYSLLMDHRSYEVHVAGGDSGECTVMIGGRPYRARLERGHGANGRGSSQRPVGARRPREARRTSPNVEMRAPLPGLLLEMQVSEGEYVTEQDVVAVLESMKMNLELRAPRSGYVRQLLVNPGRQVAQDQVLVVIGPNGASCRGDGE